MVATEIKELPRTAMATEEIKAKINGIQSSTRGAVTDIESISGVIRDVSELVGAISAAIDEQIRGNPGHRHEHFSRHPRRAGSE